MSIAEYCFISSILTILGLILIFSGIMVIGDLISKYKFNKQDRKNREEFIDWLMKQCFERNVSLFTDLDVDKFEFISNDLRLYSLSKLNDNLFEAINTQQKEIFKQEKRGEEE